MSVATKEQIIERLKTVKDPEIGIDVWTLGLIYDIKSGEEGIDILMTLTSPFCPFADELLASVEKSLEPLSSEVRVNITFEPAWEIPEGVKLTLGL